MFTKLTKWIMSRQQDTLYVPGVDELADTLQAFSFVFRLIHK